MSTNTRLTKTSSDARPLAVRVYESVRDQIVNGTIPADTQLVQEVLAENLGVSRTPVRDALNRLAHDGLVTWVPGTGYLVNPLTDESVADIYQVRQALEPLAAQLACGGHSPDQLRRLRHLVDRMADVAAGDATAMFELNRDFHIALVEPCPNQTLLNMLDLLWHSPVNRLITREYARDDDHVERMITEHRHLLNSLEAGDAEGIATRLRDHLHYGYSETSTAPLPH